MPNGIASLTPELIDNVKHFETPLGVELTLYPAGLPVRSAAFLIDFIIKITILLFVAFMLATLGTFGTGLFLICYFVLDWFYFVLWDVANNGKPPGKMVMGIRTVHADGTPITLAGSVVRSLLLIVDLLPFGYLTGAICIASTRNFSRLGDLAADTMVVHDTPTVKQTARRVLNTRKLSVNLTQDERLNFLAFQNRFELFSRSRQIELCEKLSPLTKSRRDRAVMETLEIAEGIRRTG